MSLAHMTYVMCNGCGAPGELGDDAAEAYALAQNAGFRQYLRGTAEAEPYAHLFDGRNRIDLCKSCHGQDVDWR